MIIVLLSANSSHLAAKTNILNATLRAEKTTRCAREVNKIARNLC